MFGYTREDLLGRAVETLVPDRFQAVHPGHRSSSLSDPVTRPMGAKLELSGRRSDGSEFPAEISLSSIETPEGTLAVAAIRDITERRESEFEKQALEERVRERTAQLQATNRELESFSYSISHDLRAPLRGIDGLSRLLLEEYAEDLPTEGQRYLTLVRKNAQTCRG